MNIILLTVIVIFLSILAFVDYHPVFGGKITPENLEPRRHSPNFFDGRFNNENHIPLHGNSNHMPGMLRDFLKGNRQSRPVITIPVPVQDELLAGKEGDREVNITWFGHSAFYMEIAGKSLLLDPMFGKYSSPVPIPALKRYSQKPVNIADLPEIDAVILSHDHYDHLDYKTILKLKNKVKQFHVPLGVGCHLERWGVDHEKIVQYDWWQEMKIDELVLACTPAQHFSGRSWNDRNAALWCSWIISSPQARIFFSGDGGYGPHFKAIGDKYGPFDLTLMECGQYDPRWKAIHMMPEETVQAHLDLKGKMMIPIHWGAFTLSFHSWIDPVERALQAAQEKDVIISTPQIGESFSLSCEDYPNSTWWRTYCSHEAQACVAERLRAKGNSVYEE